jgi:adenosyl cobinamide kinase/adenosyl cobinamide phosphate guanylyltransferase
MRPLHLRFHGKGLRNEIWWCTVTTTDEVMTALGDQREIGMSVLHACLTMLLTALFLS